MRHNDRELWQDFRRATDDAQAHECVPASAFYQLGGFAHRAAHVLLPSSVD